MCFACRMYLHISNNLCFGHFETDHDHLHDSRNRCSVSLISVLSKPSRWSSLPRTVRILKSQLAAKFTMLNHYSKFILKNKCGTKFWQILLVESEALAGFIVNKLRGGLKVCCVKAPGFGDNRKANLQVSCVCLCVCACIRLSECTCGCDCVCVVYASTTYVHQSSLSRPNVTCVSDCLFFVFVCMYVQDMAILRTISISHVCVCACVCAGYGHSNRSAAHQRRPGSEAG